jgi:hypothetical protein
VEGVENGFVARVGQPRRHVHVSFNVIIGALLGCDVDENGCGVLGIDQCGSMGCRVDHFIAVLVHETEVLVVDGSAQVPMNFSVACGSVRLATWMSP